MPGGDSTSLPIDAARLDELHIVRKVRETVRRWWGLELSFTDRKGQVVDHGKGIIIPPNNRICTACLGESQGLAACNRSIEEAVGRLTVATGPAGFMGLPLAHLVPAEQPKNGMTVTGAINGGESGPEARLLGPCHMGLDIVAAPVDFGGERQGALFACGFLVDRPAERLGELQARVVAGVGRLRLPVIEPAQAFETIARIEQHELPRLMDLMGTTVSEVADHAGEVALRERKIEALSRELSGRYRFDDIVGKSAAMQRLYQLLDKVVQSDVTVLVRGENGTGKELIARALHHNGPRRQKQFVAQSAAAPGDHLLESELFGHVKGAFTGATRDKVGLFKVADGGTFFLDEVGELSPGLQVKLLRVLQEGTFVPVGGTKAEKVDVRVVAATNQELRELVARRQFREDLFYRLCVLEVEVPALRDRLDDLPLLTEHLLARQAERSKRPKKRLAPAMLASFYQRKWPGNVRELENELERLAVLSGEGELIGDELLPARAAGEPGLLPLALLVEQGLAQGLSNAVEKLERELITTALLRSSGNRSRTAQLLQVSRTTLLKKIRDYDLKTTEDGA
jgi:two-component system, NtrC family, response regulator HupR/HoxA